jgi:hypothetical protein
VRALSAALVCAAALPGVGCATAAPTPDVTPLRVVAYLHTVPPAVDDLALTVYPRPQEARYGDELLPLAAARYVTGTEDFALQSVSWTAARLAPGGYTLHARAGEEGTEIVAGTGSADGRLLLERALRQLTVTIDGRQYLRACSIAAEPAFPLRGSKRPRAWEREYGANFAWGASDAAADREQVVYVAPEHPLDASAAGVERVLEPLVEAAARGVRRFAVKFDDVGFTMTSETRLAFGTYPRAVCALLSGVRERLRAASPRAVLYYLPQTYWWADERLWPFAQDLQRAGGLASDWGLVMTGPEIISESIDVAGLNAARAAFGLTSTRSLIYDNLGRETDWGPLTGRDPALLDVAAGVFGERGTAVNRLTRLDWHANPQGYDAGWSYRRAVFELAGARYYESLLAVCDAFRAARAADSASAEVDDVARRIDALARATAEGLPGPVSREELIAELRADLRHLRSGTRP